MQYGNFEISLKSAPEENFENFFFGSFQKTSKLSKNIFWASQDHIVAQKSIFGPKSRKLTKNRDFWAALEHAWNILGA